jgi:hypothetical protein
VVKKQGQSSAFDPRASVMGDADCAAGPKARRWPSSAREIRFAHDSPLEGGGFEPSVPLWRMTPGPASAELREIPAGQLRCAPDSPLEGDGFEPSVPRERHPLVELALFDLSRITLPRGTQHSNSSPSPASQLGT